jgi:hypothetical protein
MSGQWPPEWDDPEDIPGEADQQDAEAEAGLSEVAAYLASVPVPVMPGSVEARISAALAVEAAARAGVVPANGDAQGDRIARSDGPVQSDGSLKREGAADARVLGPAPARARVRRRDRQERRREREMRKIFEPRRGRDVRTVLGKFVIGPLAVCLLIVIIALGLSRAGSSSSSSSANSLGLAPVAAAPASSAPAASGAFGISSAASGGLASVHAPSAAASATSPAPGFAVIHSGTSYQRATLAQQAQAQVLAAQARESRPAAVPTATSPSSPPSPSSAAQSSSAPTAQLRACVLKVTGGVLPELVDRATYQGTPAYVIASSNRVWVVGLGCSAARPQVIASVPLAG